MQNAANRLDAMIADFDAAREERERAAALRRRAEGARPRSWRQVGAALRWNAPSDADAETLRAASLAAVEAEMDWGEAEEALPFPAEEMGPPQDACEA